MARLPSIDRNTWTILICGYPNVGRSPFMNKVTKADGDVQPYAFATKSLFVGHTDDKYLRYQVIDTPGILDRPFEDHNIIQIIAQQVALFHSIKSLFMNKPLIIVCNKTDLQPLDGLSEEDMKLVLEMKAEAMKTVMGHQGGYPANEEGVLSPMSTLTEDGVIGVKNAACERLLDRGVELKMKSKKINDCLNRFHVAIPNPRHQKERPPFIPQAVLEAQLQAAEKEKRKTEKDLENENGGAGLYSASLRKNYMLVDDEWKEDIMPEILDGHNVYEFVDPDILLRLEELGQEEGLRQAEEENEDFEMDDNDLIKKSTAESRPIIPRKFDKNREFTTERMGRQLSQLGLDPSLAINCAWSKSRGRKRERSLDRRDSDIEAMDVDVDQSSKKLCLRSSSRSRSKSRPPSEVVPGEGFKDTKQKVKALKLAKKSVKKRNKDARREEADRVLPTLKPKHLSSGKRSIGKTQRRCSTCGISFHKMPS
ncbi:hypothetical protein SLEP1_g37028 [Rubroshorea leprosula]|nr:hypothetical protein SLEP1_g37028 [Rubroshorea leprosula]